VTFEVQMGERVLRLAVAAPTSQAPSPGRAAARLVGLFTALLIVAGLLVVVVVLPGSRPPILPTVNVANLTLGIDPGASWSGSVLRAQAEERALAKIHDLDPSVQNLRVVSARQVAGVFTVTDEEGQRQFSSTTAVDGWVFEVTGNSVEFTYATGWAMVDGDTGRIIAADILQAN
jgi:hypothetical protein